VDLFHRVALLLAASALLLVHPAHADNSASASYASSVTISEAGGNSWQLDLTPFLTYDSASGNVGLPVSGSSLGENWSWSKVDAIDAAGATYQADGLTWHSSETVDGTGTPWRATFTFYTAGNVDPNLSYGFSARNNTATTQTYTFSYGESVSPAFSGPYSLYADVSGSVTNSVAGVPAAIAPVNPAGIQVLSLSTDGGATLFDAGASVGPAFSTGPGTGTTPYGLYSTTRVGNALTPIDYWRIDTQLTLTPGRDAAALSGFAEITPLVIVPEPSLDAAILGSCTLAFLAWRRRSRRLA
jgi:hypothetical protein